jgi:hypothetical protein
MRLTEAMDAIRNIVVTVPGVNTAPIFVPNRILSSDLPLAFIIVRGGGWQDYIYGQAGTHTRQFDVFFYVKPVAHGTLDEGYMKTVRLLENVARAFVEYQNNDLCESWFRTATFEDGGHVILNYAQNDYHGFVFTINVRIPFTY